MLGINKIQKTNNYSDIEKCKDLNNQNWEPYILAKDQVLIGGLIFLDDWVLRAETSNALGKLFVKNIMC